MAGLSMGGMQSFMTVLGNLDKFAYLGGFSGSSGGRGASTQKPPISVRRCCLVQQKNECAVFGNRLRGRAGHEEFQ
jgi:hypothetical protein